MLILQFDEKNMEVKVARLALQGIDKTYRIRLVDGSVDDCRETLYKIIRQLRVAGWNILVKFEGFGFLRIHLQSFKPGR